MGFGVCALIFRVYQLGMWGLGFGVWGLGFGFVGLGFRVEGLGFRVQDLGCKGLGLDEEVSGLGFRVEGFDRHTRARLFKVRGCRIVYVRVRV